MGRRCRLKRSQIRDLDYLIRIPLPYLDRRGRPLPKPQLMEWRRRLESDLTTRFGGYIPTRAPAHNQVDVGGGRFLTLYEKGQILLEAACKDRKTFLGHRVGLAALVEAMGKDLDQQDVIVIGYASDSFLIEVSHGDR